MKKFSYIIIVCLFIPQISIAQRFVQVFNYPLFYNSAFAGTESCSNTLLINELHPMGGGLNFYSNNLLVDFKINSINSGLKFNILHKATPQKVFVNQSFAFAYAYNNKITRKIRFSLSVQAKYHTFKISQSNLIFPNMLSVYSNQVENNTEILSLAKNNNIYFGGGGLIYGKNFYFSVFVDNFFAIYQKEAPKTPLTICFIGDKKLFSIKRNFKIKFNTALFYSNKFINSINTILLKNKQFSVGLLSLQNFYNNQLSNGLGVSAGYSVKRISFNYSYSFFYGKLLFSKQTNHEINIKFKINCKEKKRNNTINCPTYKL